MIELILEMELGKHTELNVSGYIILVEFDSNVHISMCCIIFMFSYMFGILLNTQKINPIR